MVRTRLKPEQRKELLLDAAAEVIVTKGAEALTIEAVAATAGVNRGLVHYYFTNRDNVLVALYERARARFDLEMQAAVDRGGPGFEGRLRSLVDGWLAGAEHQRLLDALEAARSESGRLEAARAHSALVAVQGISDGLVDEFGFAADEAMVTAGILLSGARAVLPAWGVTGWERERIRDHYVAMCMAAVRSVAPVARDRG